MTKNGRRILRGIEQATDLLRGKEVPVNVTTFEVPVPEHGDVQCYRCKRWGFALDEFTSPWTGLCAKCMDERKHEG